MRRRKGPLRPDAAIAAVAAAQGGAVSLDQLRDAGIGARAAQRRAARGSLHRVHRGVYAVGHPRLGVAGLRHAALLACGPAAVLSHWTAGAILELLRSFARAIGVTTTDRGRKGVPGIELHRVRALAPQDVVVVDGLRVTSVARTLVDLAGVLSHDQLERAVHEADYRRLLDRAAVIDAIGRASRRRGVGRLAALLGEPSAGVTRSVLEERFLALCRRSGLPLPRLNATVRASGRALEVDCLWLQARVIVELDGAAAHRTARAFEEDRKRDALLAAAGFVVVRLTWRRVAEEGAAVVSELATLLAARQWALRANPSVAERAH